MGQYVKRFTRSSVRPKTGLSTEVRYAANEEEAAAEIRRQKILKREKREEELLKKRNKVTLPKFSWDE